MSKSKKKAQPSEEEQLRQISKKEMAKHNTPKDCWLCIEGKVYDVTDYHIRHPGGSDLITQHAGKFGPDVDEDYEDAEHSTAAKNFMKKFLIGVLVQ